MKISRKSFIRRSMLSILGISLMPKVFGLVPNRKFFPEKRKLGNTGIKVSSIGFGTPRTQEPAVLKNATEKGITFLDTGRAYANGQNEIMIGKVLKGKREKFVIQSKMKVDLEEGAATPEDIEDQMETSLKESLSALQTDYIDVMLLHGVRNEELLQNKIIREVFAKMKNRGAIKACGFSTHANHINMLKEANRDNFFDVAMVPFNPFGAFRHSQSGWSTSWDQKALIKEMKKAREHGTGIVAMKTCSGGAYAFQNKKQSTFSGAVQWVLSHKFVDTAVVAMANFGEIREHTE